VRTCIRWTFICSAILWLAVPTRSQSLVNAGTIEGSVVNPSSATVAKAEVNIHDAVSGYLQSVLSGLGGEFQLVNIPPGQCDLEIKALAF
jgi:hypothetical protein